MKKIALIIPGFGESEENNPAYWKIAGYFRKQKISPVIARINWKRRVMSEYVAQFQEFFIRHINAGDEVYLLGFSYGAMIAFISSVELKPKGMILCSLSPFFQEDLRTTKKWWRNLSGKRRMIDHEKFSFTKLAYGISTKTIILMGDREGPEIELRSKDANRKIKRSELVVIPGVQHKIGQPEYLEKIQETIKNLT